MAMFPDISEFQGAVDWDALGAAFAAGQIEAVSMRAGFGTVRADAQFTRNRAECRTRGIPAIFYWFNYPTFNSAHAEAAMFNQIVGPLQAHEAMMGDFEDDPTSNSVFPRGQAGVNWATDFLTALRAPRNATWFYTYTSLFTAVGMFPLLATWPFVWADYSPRTDDPFNAVARQFTDCGATPGVTGCCDQNRVLKPPLSRWLTGGDALTQEQFNQLMNTWLASQGNMSLADLDALRWRVEALVSNSTTVTGGPTAGEVNQLKARLDSLTNVAAIKPVLDAVGGVQTTLDGLTLKKV